MGPKKHTAHEHGSNNNCHHHGNHQCNSNHNNNAIHVTKKQHVQTIEPEVTKLDQAVAKYLRNHLPNKEAMFLGIKRVNFFVGSKAVDALMESNWAQGEDAIFKNRNDARDFLHELLIKKFYHRARKIVKMDGAKRKFKLDMHDEQVFQDANQPYVWLYEPTSITAWLLCFGVIFGVIAICLFPLWPPIIRTWIYYLCIAGLGFLSSILGLAVIRHIVYLALWTITFGKLHFWILPNLTEDVGFLESFWPVYAFGDSDSSGSSPALTKSEGDGGAGHSHQD